MPAQIKMINSINRLLSRNDTAIQLNPEGVCGGLVCMRIRYRFEGREAEFFDLCRQLANPPKDYVYGNGSKLDLFIRDIEIEFNRNKYTQAKSLQGDMEKAVLIQGKPIRKEFAIGLVESKTQWAAILEQLRHDGRSCYVASHTHAIEMTFENGRYEIYDPNYDEDNPNQAVSAEKTKNVRTFTKASEVIEELCRQFGYPDEQVGLSIHIYANPHDPSPAVYPDKKALVSKFTQTEFDRQIGITDKQWVYNSLYFAAYVNDTDTIQAYLDHNQVTPYQAAYLMHTDRWNKELLKLYKLKNKDDKLHLLTYALWQGNPQLFAQLLEAYESEYASDSQKQEFKAYIGKDFHFLIKAAECRNATCLRAVFELYKKYAIDYTALSSTQLSGILHKISERGDIDCLKTLRAYLPNLPFNYLSEALRVAAEHDRQSVVQFWLNEIKELSRKDKSPVSAKTRNLSLKSVQKLSLPTFTQLLQVGLKVDASMIPQLLKRKDRRFFEAWIDNTSGTDRYRELISHPSPDLSQGLDLHAFLVLCRYDRNALIEKHWTEEADSFGVDALAFACETGNKAMATFLAKRGFRLDKSYTAKALKAAMAGFEFEKVQAILAVPVEVSEFFTKENKALIYQLIGAGEIGFIFRAWKKLSADQKQDYLLHAVSIGSREFCEKLAARYPRYASTYIEVLLDAYKSNNQYTEVLDAAIYLADSLKATHFAECVHQLTDVYEQLLYTHEKADNAADEKAFRSKARQSISGLIALLTHAIEHHRFGFALKLMSFVHLSNEEQEQLLVKAYARKETAILEFMLENYPGFRANPTNHFNLEAQKEYGLLAKLLEGAQVLDNAVYMALLKRAVAREDERVIALLSRYINTAFRAQGSPMYDAIQQGHVNGILLLLKYGARVHEHPIPDMLFTLAIQQPTADLLHLLLQNRDFLTHFHRELGDNLNRLFHHASPAVLLYAAGKVDMAANYQEFLHHALTHDDVPLLQRLKQTEQFKTADLHKLFDLACEHQASAVVNELLASPLSFDDRKALHGKLDKLFGVANPDSEIDAQTIYERVYPKALYRLYELVKTERYRPFAALHSSIYTMIGDEGLFKASHVRNEHRQGLLRSRLISNALDKGDQVILNQLLQQLENKPPVNQEIIDIFAANLQKPLIISVLLEHFPLDSVIEEAIAQKKGLVIVSLLKGKPASALSGETLQRLKKHSDLLLFALLKKARQELADDPRAQLNALLIPNSPLALAQVLANQALAIKKIITHIQDLMIRNKQNLNMRFYDFELEKKIMDDLAAMEEIQPLIDEWVSKLPVYATRKEADDNLNQDALNLLNQPKARDAVRQIRTYLKKHDLTPHGFDEKKQLHALFDALEKREAEEHQQPLLLIEPPEEQAETPDQEELKIQEKSLPVPNPPIDNKPLLAALMSELENYKQARSHYGQTRHAISWFQYTKDDKESAIRQLVEALKSPHKGINLHDESVLLNGRLHDRLDAFMAQHGKALAKELHCDKPLSTLEDLIDYLNTRDPVSSLISILEQYHTARDAKPERYHWSIFSQFTGTEKKAAAKHLIERLKGNDVVLSENDMAALQQGSLGEEIETFIELYGKALKQQFNRAVFSLYDLVECCRTNQAMLNH
ncbi:hypothetical protein [Legionella taurinensis]|uniref:Ankyrin repeat domain-containing protein n=1 Tax=Legionella taurinensis TaxID=70611 RepID=A0A3A5L0T1_9GAMM|nr:hypothetical protein [Legionella taurinensis]RJT43672.1 hypothetical protein D6J04_13980 [Legionella taurinensis]RJT64765.1 hypothetical protein D6J03_14290 [Legionella taurinensis]STY26600.1 ankyrin repeat-containing protein [Legionella taurinensis]